MRNDMRFVMTVLVPLVCSVTAAERPNVIVILTDDMGFSDLGCYGGEIKTPNLDKLAANGLRFTQFYNTGRCCPTRASLLTGTYPHQAHVGWMVDSYCPPGNETYSGELNPQCTTIAEALRPAGYRTYMTGKWHVTKHQKPEGPKNNWPRQRGFDRYYGTIAGAGSFYDPGTLTRDNTAISPFNDPEYTPERYYYTHAISDHAVRFVNEHKRDYAEKPFFMYVAYTAAHWPMHALEEDIALNKGRYSAGYDAIRRARLERARELGVVDTGWTPTETVGNWDTVENKAWEERCMEVYAAMIGSMDQGVGKLVAALEKNGQLENTLILFMQDNGGCQEGVGRGKGNERPAQPTLKTIAKDTLRQDIIPKQDRAGIPTLMGSANLPGGPETYIAYGMNWANVSNTPYREYKHFVHEGGISTPLIAHWPAGIAAERRNKLEKEPAHLIDIEATCLAAAGTPQPAEQNGKPVVPLEGISLLPIFRGETVTRGKPIYFEHEGNRAVRDGKWKLVGKANRKWELYDMERDRTETNDLAADESVRVKEMSAQYEAWAERVGALPWPLKKNEEKKGKAK